MRWLRETGDAVDLETGWTVYPEEGNFPAVAKALLAVADHPNQVRSVSHPRAGFHVPDDVFERFTQADRVDPVGPMMALGPERLVAEPQQQPQELPKRRGGRPRKNTEPTKEG